MAFIPFLVRQSLLVLFFVCITESNNVRNDIYGGLMRYLKTYNDVDVGGLVVLHGQIDDIGFTKWFKYAILDDEDILIESYFPSVYLNIQNKFDMLDLLKVLNRSKDANLIVIDGSIENSFNFQEFVQNLSIDLLQDHLWLYFHPFSNITSNNIRRMQLFEELLKYKHLTLTSQVSKFESLMPFVTHVFNDYVFFV